MIRQNGADTRDKLQGRRWDDQAFIRRCMLMVTFEQNGHKRGGVVVHPSPFFFFASGSRDNKAVRRLTDRLVVCLCERSVDAVRVNVMPERGGCPSR